MRGIYIDIYRTGAQGDCTNGGVSATADEAFVPLPDGIERYPDCDKPVLLLVKGRAPGAARLVPQEAYEARRWTMMGGNYGATSDSRFDAAVRKITGSPWYGAVPIHDRIEG